MGNFRLPRKLKKQLKTRFIFLYPPNDKGGRLMGWPWVYQKDYDAYKEGILEYPFKKVKFKHIKK